VITNAVANWLIDVLTSLLGSLPSLPDSLMTTPAAMGAELVIVFGYIVRLSPVVPFTMIGTATIFLATCWTLAIVLRGVRMVISLLTLGGGGV
jgi:hypothetical protein